MVFCKEDVKEMSATISFLVLRARDIIQCIRMQEVGSFLSQLCCYNWHWDAGIRCAFESFPVIPPVKSFQAFYETVHDALHALDL